MKFSIRFHRFLFLCIALLAFQNGYAHEVVKSYNQISLEASSSAEVDNDTMMVSMYVQEEGSKAVDLSNKVNKKINWALEKLKKHTDIKVETESYSTNPVYNKNHIVAWRVRQSIQMQSKNMSLLSEVLGELQQQLKLNGITFDVSREAREKNTQVLIDQALAAFNKRATQIANNLKNDSYKIVNMRVTTTNNPSPYQYRGAKAMMAESSAMVAPEIAKGDKTLTANVSGTIELQ